MRIFHNLVFNLLDLTVIRSVTRLEFLSSWDWLIGLALKEQSNSNKVFINEKKTKKKKKKDIITFIGSTSSLLSLAQLPH